MRRLIRLILVSALAAGLLASAGCKRKARKMTMEPADEETTSLATMVHVADPRATVQLIRGFHDVEQNAWRWTMRKFSVTLKTPAGAAARGATLQLKFVIPDVVLAKLKSLALSASVEGTPLAGETYTAAGEQTYTRDVPPQAFKADAVTVDFVLDKALPPGPADRRELGVIVTTAGLEAR